MIVLAFLIVVFVAYLWAKDRRFGMLLVMITWPVANEVTDLLKAGFKGLRPCVELPNVIVRLEKLTSFGTASAHSANMMAVAVAMWLLFGRRHGIMWLTIAILTGISRIYVGVHYPYQVALGWACGAIIAYVVVNVGKQISRKYFPVKQSDQPGNDANSKLSQNA